MTQLTDLKFKIKAIVFFTFSEPISNIFSVSISIFSIFLHEKTKIKKFLSVTSTVASNLCNGNLETKFIFFWQKKTQRSHRPPPKRLLNDNYIIWHLSQKQFLGNNYNKYWYKNITIVKTFITARISHSITKNTPSFLY